MPISDVNNFVKPTIDYILDMQYPSKNIPSSVGSRNYDVLVQWCHGAPGAIHMVTLAYEVNVECVHVRIIFNLIGSNDLFRSC